MSNLEWRLDKEERPKERWEVVYNTLHQEILDGQLRPTERILEVPLAQRFGVSRGPVREAIRQLEADGLIARHPRLGSYVAAIGTRDVDQLYRLRSVIEEYAVRMAMEANPISVRHELAMGLMRLRASVSSDRPSEFASADLAFHSIFYELSGNRWLVDTWTSLRDPLAVLMGRSRGRDRGEWAQTAEDHLAILQAVESGNVDACIAEVDRHLAVARERAVHGRQADEQELSELGLHA